LTEAEAARDGSDSEAFAKDEDDGPLLMPNLLRVSWRSGGQYADDRTFVWRAGLDRYAVQC